MSRLARLQQLFDQLADLDSAARVAVLDRECVDAPDLRAELEALLASDKALARHTARKAVGQLDAMLLDAQPESLVGAQVGRYTLIKPIGAGGMGAVYLAERNDGVVQQRVAIKFLARDLLAEGFRQRFELERHVLAQLDHPSITRLIDADELADGTPYYVMDYVEGVPITRYASAQRLDLRARLTLMIEVAKAVAHAHQALIVHRDLKPGNILVDAQGQPKLLDFGIAKPLAAQLGGQVISQTITGQRFFSPQHAAPEQLLGEAITVGCDIYGLGTLLYELLTGEPALSLTGLSAAEAETKILHQMPDPPSQRVARREQARASGRSNDASTPSPADAEPVSGKPARTSRPPEVPSRSLRGELDAIVLNCLRKRASERYRSVDDLIADMQAYLDGRPVQARGGHGWYRARKFIARHRWAATAAGLTAMALIGSSVLTYLQSREAQAQRDAAQLALADAEQQRDRAQRVTQFLIDAFAAANPGGELGKNVTAREILERGAKQLETDLTDQPELKAQLLATIAEAQFALSLFEDARKTSTEAVALSAGTGWSAERSARSSLASVAIAERDLDLAFEQLDALNRIPADLDDQAKLVNLRLWAYSRTGEFLESRRIAEEFLKAYASERRAGAKAMIYRIRLKLAVSYRMLKEHELALNTIESVLGDMREDPDVGAYELIYAHGIGSGVYGANGRMDEALSAALFAVERATVFYGRESRTTVNAMTSLSNVHAKRGDIEKSIYYAKEVVRIQNHLYGERSLDGMTSEYNLALAYQRAGANELAIKMLGDLLERSRAGLPAGNAARLIYLEKYAQLLLDSGRRKEARQALVAGSEDLDLARETPDLQNRVDRILGLLTVASD